MYCNRLGGSGSISFILLNNRYFYIDISSSCFGVRAEFSEDAGSQKPQKEYFDYCFSRIPDANPRRMLLIGDSPASDIKGGMAAGTYTCWYNPGGNALPEGIRADYEVGSLKELMNLL